MRNVLNMSYDLLLLLVDHSKSNGHMSYINSDKYIVKSKFKHDVISMTSVWRVGRTLPRTSSGQGKGNDSEIAV